MDPSSQVADDVKVNEEVPDAQPPDIEEDVPEVKEELIHDHEADDDESETESEDEPDVWRCECCRKDVKSAGQMENHVKTKSIRTP